MIKEVTGITLRVPSQTRKGHKGNGNLSESDPLKKQESAAEKAMKEQTGARCQSSGFSLGDALPSET
jgi:hypothetical protein